MFGDLVEGIVESVGWGIGGAAVVVVALVGGSRAKPLAKQVIKGYLAATERVRALTAEASESLQDVYAEAKHEYESQVQGEAARGAQAGPAEQRGETAPGQEPR